MSGTAQLVTSGPLILALPVAAAAGAVTFLSPCCLPLVPGYLSFVTGMAGASGATPAAAVAQPTVAAEGGAGLVSFPLPVATPEITVSEIWHPRMNADAAHRWLRGLVVVVCSGRKGGDGVAE
jgi:hypothetical protein